jgi:hypothetical protein
LRVVVDVSNVMGSRPDGWWRDRNAATARLLDALEAFARGSEDEVVAVLDAGPPDWAGRRETLEVVLASRRGRDAADDEIVALVEREPEGVRVVTSDRTLAERVRALGAQVEGAKAFRDRLDAG